MVPSADYRLGSGDLLDVQIAGRLEVSRQQVVIDPEGFVSIPPAGAVAVGGLTLREASRRVSERARTLLRFGDVTLSVVTPRCFEVILSGEVEHPGSLQAAALRRVHEVILAAGGITPRGSLRRVEITRAGGERATVDLLKFELQGDLAQNPPVEEGMRIHVPARGPSVTLSGAFRRPGDYEIAEGESLADLIELSGGLAYSAAAGEARLTRVGRDGRKETVSLDLRQPLAPTQGRLGPGDVVVVPSLGILQDVVEVRGAFNGVAESSRTATAGKATIVQRFELARGDRVRDVVARVGGPAAYADLRLAFVERSGAGGPRQRIPVDLHALLVDKDDAQNILLDNGDVLTLPVVEDKVYVLGEVRTPGPVDYRPELTPREYLALAGGPTVRARFRNATVTMPDGKSYLLAQAPPLQPGAVVTVPEVAVRWYQDYVAIATAVAGLVTAYTGLFFLFDANRGGN